MVMDGTEKAWVRLALKHDVFGKAVQYKKGTMHEHSASAAQDKCSIHKITSIDKA